MEERNEPLFENNLDIAMHHFCQALLELIIASRFSKYPIHIWHDVHGSERFDA